MSQQAKLLRKDITITVTLPYLLYLPKEYDPQRRWPLVLFLHGSGGRGNDLTALEPHSLPGLVEDGREFPFMIISPQCPNHLTWFTQLPALRALLDEVVGMYAVDADRVYLTGLSMGGYGTWAMAAYDPQRFAAIIPICSAGHPGDVSAIQHIPTWVFHGEKDDMVPLEDVAETVYALKACGGNVKFTVYPGAGHNAWTETYNNSEVFTWLLSQRREKTTEKE